MLVSACLPGGSLNRSASQVAPTLESAYAKMYFVVIWGAFAFSLYLLNLLHGRKVYDEIAHWDDGIFWKFGPICCNWKAIVLLLTGFVGGICSAIAGSGLDICTFSVLTLLFRVSEKIATPTSVLLMAINTVVGFLYREFCQGGVEPSTWGWFLVCIPIVCIGNATSPFYLVVRAHFLDGLRYVGGPIGSLVGSYFHRLVLAAELYLTDSVQLIAALWIVQPWTNKHTSTPLHLCLTSLALLVGGMIYFKLLVIAGQKLIDQHGDENIHDNKPTDEGIVEQLNCAHNDSIALV